jgi:hypothetical protein
MGSQRVYVVQNQYLPPERVREWSYKSTPLDYHVIRVGTLRSLALTTETCKSVAFLGAQGVENYKPEIY